MASRIHFFLAALSAVFLGTSVSAADFYATGGDVKAYYLGGNAGDGSDFTLNKMRAGWDSKQTFLGVSTDFGSFAAGSAIDLGLYNISQGFNLAAAGNGIASSFAGGTYDFYWHNVTIPSGTLLSFNDGPVDQDFNDLLVVVTNIAPSSVAAVPEAGTWIMLIMGFGMIGTLMRRLRDRQSGTLRLA